VLGVSALCLPLTACGSGSDERAEPGSSASVTRTALATAGTPSSAGSSEGGDAQLVPEDGGIDASYSVGDYELHLTCVGPASPKRPTIVYLHGLGGDGGDVNDTLAPDLAERGRLCTYGRVNVGRSGRESDGHTGTESVKDLKTLLMAAEVSPPYHLVGFSFGGLIASMYAGTYPDDVVGVLLIDSSLPTDAEVDALIPAGTREQVMRDQQANGERVDFYVTLQEAGALMGSVPDIPITYLAARPVELPTSWPVRQMRT